MDTTTDSQATADRPGRIADPFPAEYRADPYPLYDWVRGNDPVHRAPDGNWVLVRYADASFVLRDPRFSNNPSWLGPEAMAQGATSPIRVAGSRVMMFLDPPDHTRLRSLVSKAFTPKVVEGLRPRIQALVDEALDAVAEQGEMDVLADLGYPLPTIVICELLGVPVEDRELFKDWSADASRLLDGHLPSDVETRGLAATMQLAQYFTDLVEKRKADPRDDLLSAMIAAEEGGQRLTHEELLTTSTLLLLAGFETTMNLVGNGVLVLLQHPSELARLRSDPALDRPAVEELLRFEGPVHVTARIATTDVEVGGQLIRKGEQAAVVLAAANRDPDQFADPNRLDVGRADNRHLAFAAGAHYCLGAALARIEARAAIATLVRRFPDLALVTTEPQWRDHFVIRGLKELRVRFTPGRAAARSAPAA
ncbi:MAG TPA: cytochrome P450 [Acidimicrobiales bacterium]|nr:cytochrome P450 [Acidimicrobiales bacterium]